MSKDSELRNIKKVVLLQNICVVSFLRKKINTNRFTYNYQTDNLFNCMKVMRPILTETTNAS